MFIAQEDPFEGGPLPDSERRDTMVASEGPDVFVLSNDGRADTVWGMNDGIDLIDISAFEASPDQISIKQKSPTDFVVDYLDEERIHVSFAPPPDLPAPGEEPMLTLADFVFATGLPPATVQVIVEREDEIKEVLFGTSSPDIFLFAADGQRDTVRRFEPGKDLIDLAEYGVTFGDLEVVERKVGRLSIKIPVGDPEADLPPDQLVLIDLSKSLTAEDLSPAFFIF